MMDGIRLPAPWAHPLSFASAFDAALASSGPPAVFVVDHEGRLRMQHDRSRDHWERLAPGLIPHHRWVHVLARDRGTGWVQYLLITSPELAESHPRAELEQLSSAEEALARLAALGRLPLARSAGD